MGIVEQIVFPEIHYDKVQRITGMNVTFVTSAGTDAAAAALLRKLGLPLKQSNSN
jgi:large subunit ribosomal protein L5